MGSKETRLQRGRRRGVAQASEVLGELRLRRVTYDVSLQAMASQLDCAMSTAWRREKEALSATVVGLAEMASVLGMELSVKLYPIGDPIRDKGQQALGLRFDSLVGPAWRSTAEALLPGARELRAWDRLLRLVGHQDRYLVGVDLETRIRDIQELTRRTRERERDGQCNAVLIVLSDSAVNRRLAGQLIKSLGEAYKTPSREIRRCLRDGLALPGSGVLLV